MTAIRGYEGRSLEDMMALFLELDTNRDERVDMSELNRAYERRNLSRQDIQVLVHIFPPMDSIAHWGEEVHKIHIANQAKVLGSILDHHKGGGQLNKIINFTRIFDQNRDGVVTLGEFCRGLGVNINEMRQLRDTLLQQKGGRMDPIPSDFSIQAGSMPRRNQVNILEKFRSYYNRHGKTDLNNLAIEMKSYLETTYGGVWHVLIGGNSYAIQYSFDPFNMLQFMYDNHSVLMWRTSRGKV